MAAPERRRRLRGTLASLDLWLARRRGQLSAAIGLAALIDPLATGHHRGEIALGGDLRAAALMNLGTAEAWSLRVSDGERHLTQGAELARQIGRPYLEVGCLAQLGFASKLRSFNASRQYSQEAISLAERHGWDADPAVAPALMTLACSMIWAGEFSEGERWLRRAVQAVHADSGPGIAILLHLVTGMLHAGRGRHDAALHEFSAAQYLQSHRVQGQHALASLVTGWTLATQARLGRPGEARAALVELPAERAGTGEIRNADAVICLAQGDPAGALRASKDVVEGTAPVIGDFTLVETHLLGALAHRELGDQRAANQAAEGALALAEADRIILPFVMTGSAVLLKTLPRHETAHAALLTEILDGMPGAAPRSHPAPPAGELSPTELRVLRFLPTNLSRPEIARELSVSVNTVSTHVRSIYAKLGADNRSCALERARSLGLISSRLPAARPPRGTSSGGLNHRNPVMPAHLPVRQPRLGHRGDLGAGTVCAAHDGLRPARPPAAARRRARVRAWPRRHRRPVAREGGPHQLVPAGPGADGVAARDL
jgi:LuxR family maltose regulon positive regulatory protein